MTLPSNHGRVSKANLHSNFLWILDHCSEFVTIKRHGTAYTSEINSAFHPSGVGKSSTGLSAVKAERVHLCRVTANTVIT